MKSRGVAKMMFNKSNSCALQDRIGFDDISLYFLYTLLTTVIFEGRRINFEKIKNNYKNICVYHIYNVYLNIIN